MDGRVCNFMQLASVRRYEMTEGKERGLRVIDCENGKLRFLLNESKALDVMQMYHCGQNVSFVSKNGFTLREIPFANRFEGGMLYTCGLDSIGARQDYELHGTLHNTPARVTRAECGEEGIIIEAEIADTLLFGKNFVFKRRIFSAIGSETLEISDTLENRGFRDEEYCLLYHVNVGYPMLDDGTKVEGAVCQVTPRTEWAAKYVSEREKIFVPIANQEEMCYFLQFEQPKVSLVNKKIGKKFTLEWSQDTLPHFVEWKSMTSGDYALGLEPCTSCLDQKFHYSVLQQGECVEMRLLISVETYRLNSNTVGA